MDFSAQFQTHWTNGDFSLAARVEDIVQLADVGSLETRVDDVYLLLDAYRWTLYDKISKRQLGSGHMSDIFVRGDSEG